MNDLTSDLRVTHAARVLVADHFCTRRDESVLITADTETDRALVTALVDAAAAVGARPAVITMPRLPFQGRWPTHSLPTPCASPSSTATCGST